MSVEPIRASIPAAGLAYETPPTFEPGLAVTLGIVGMRLIGFYFMMVAVAAVPQLIYLVTTFSDSSTPFSQRVSMLTFLLYPLFHGGLGWWVFVKGGRLAVRLFARIPDAQPGTSAVSAHQVATLLVAAVGLFTIAISLPAIANVVVSIINGRLQNISPYTNVGRSVSTALLDASTVSTLVTTFVQPAAGLYLLLRADRVTRLMSRYLDAK